MVRLHGHARSCGVTDSPSDFESLGTRSIRVRTFWIYVKWRVEFLTLTEDRAGLTGRTMFSRLRCSIRRVLLSGVEWNVIQWYLVPSGMGRKAECSVRVCMHRCDRCGRSSSLRFPPLFTSSCARWCGQLTVTQLKVGLIPAGEIFFCIEGGMGHI